jgi:peptidylprolyl isomerase
MGKPLRLALAATLVLGWATGCSGTEPGPLDKVTWTDGKDGAAPTLTFEAPLAVSDPVYRIVKEGDGAVAKPGSVAIVEYVSYDGATGAPGGGTYDTGRPMQFTVAAKGSAEAAGSPLYGAIADHTVGTQAIAAFLQTQENSQDGVPVLVALTITDVKKATVVPPASPDLPTVTLVEDGRPSIKVPDGAPPADLVTQVLEEGDGAEVKEGDSLTVNRAGWVWGSASAFADSWAVGVPEILDLVPGDDTADPLAKDWIQGLAGKKVGSTVLLVIPPGLAYGDQAQGDAIPADSTLVIVVEIRGINP